MRLILNTALTNFDQLWLRFCLVWNKQNTDRQTSRHYQTQPPILSLLCCWQELGPTSYCRTLGKRGLQRKPSPKPADLRLQKNSYAQFYIPGPEFYIHYCDSKSEPADLGCKWMGSWWFLQEEQRKATFRGNPFCLSLLGFTVSYLKHYLLQTLNLFVI